MAGTIRDPLVARDVLLGCALGAVNGLIQVSGPLVSHTVTGVLPRVTTSPRPFLGATHILSELAWTLVLAIFIALTVLFALFVLRRLAGGAPTPCSRAFPDEESLCFVPCESDNPRCAVWPGGRQRAFPPAPGGAGVREGVFG